MTKETGKKSWGARVLYGLLAYAVVMALVAAFLLLTAQHQPTGNPNGAPVEFGFTSLTGVAPQTTTTAPVTIPSWAPTLGSAKAPVTIIEFGDFQCPFCRAAVSPLRQLANEYPSQVRLVFRQFPIESLHPLATNLAEAALCANDQGKFWDFHDRLFQDQDTFTLDTLDAEVSGAGLDLAAFHRCYDNHRFQNAVQQDYQDALAAGSQGTPTWFVNGRKIEGYLTIDTWRQLVNGLLK